MAKLSTGTVRQRTNSPTPTPVVSLQDMVGAVPGVPQSLKGVFFGPPKTKKTTAACSGGSTLLVNYDPEGYSTGTLLGRKDIDIVQPKDFNETNQVVQAIIGGEADKYDFIVVDSVTFMFQLFGGKEITSTYMSGKDIRRAYGQGGAAVSQIINDLCMLRNKNIIFNAHLQKEFDDDDGITQDQDLGEHEVKLAVTPMVWKILGPAVGFIGRTFKQERFVDGNTESEYYVSFNDGSRSPAGSRYDMAGEYVISDSLLKDLAGELLGGN